MRMTRRGFVALVAGVIVSIGIAVPGAFAADKKVFLKSAMGGTLFRVYPDASSLEKDSVLFLELNGAPYERGLQHGLLLASQIVDVIGNRYACSLFAPEVLAWVSRAHEKMPREWQDEIRGIADGLSQNGYNIPFAEIVLHATQLPVYGTQFPWFLCAWEEPASPTGSFSYAVWGKYTLGGGTIALNSPDWGTVPFSLARNRVIVSVRPNIGNRLVFSGVAGVIGMPGFNETGLSIAGTAGPVSAGGSVMPSFDNGRPIPDGFMTLFMIARHTLQYVSAQDPQWAERMDELFAANKVDNFHIQVTASGRSIVWESGAANSPDYPRIAHREAGEWDNNGAIMPVDWRGEFVLTQTGILRMDALPPVEVKSSYHDGSPYGGTVLIDGYWKEWRRWSLGRAFMRAADPNRGKVFENWFANLGKVKVPVPVALDDSAQPNAIVSVSQDGSGGYWILSDGSDHGSWVASGNTFRAFGSDGAEAGSGRLYDFGNGVTGWAHLGDSDLEFVAWKFNLPSGANERLDAMNLSVLPAVRPWVDAVSNGLDRIVPHARTQFLLKYLGEPTKNIGLEEIYKIFQRAYLAIGGVDQPFGVGAYDLQNLNALFTVSHYEGKGNTYIGGLNPAQKPIALNRYQLFGR